MAPDIVDFADAFPDPFARAPRVCVDAAASINSLRLAPASLQGLLVALVARDTGKLALKSEQRLTHFPASPLVTISWFRGMESGLVGRCDNPPDWQRFGAEVVVSGGWSHPTVSWAPSTGSGCIACFDADAAKALFGLDLAAVQDRFVPVTAAISQDFAPLWRALLASDDTHVMTVLESHLAARWQALQGRSSARPSLRQLGRNWVERLGWQVDEWRRVHSARHVERRIKSFSGRSLREWQSLVRTEGLFFAARDRHEAGLPLDWAGLALDEGFSDQAHMSRTVKRITGFSPGEFAQRFIEDESFWLYRLWV